MYQSSNEEINGGIENQYGDNLDGRALRNYSRLKHTAANVSPTDVSSLYLRSANVAAAKQRKTSSPYGGVR